MQRVETNIAGILPSDRAGTIPDGIEEAHTGFLRAFPAYKATSVLDDLRKREFSRLDETGHVYLDYTGGSLYSSSQLTKHVDMLEHGIYGNPHSNNPSSLAITKLDEHARNTVLRFFNASPEEYVVIFTQNASGAMKLVGESYPFDKDSRYLLTFDNHNAANGIREFARARGAAITYVPVEAPELRVRSDELQRQLEKTGANGHKLFTFPAQSNFSGVQHSLEWISKAQSLGWDVLVDAAAFVPTNRLDLGTWHPDFVPLSFYKMFGYPTGVGCLIAKRSALKKLHRPWFSGGTIKVASVQGDRYFLAEGETGFEDGTINYLSLPAVEIGLQFLTSIGIDTIHDRVVSLAGWLLEVLGGLRHSNGSPVAEIYGPRTTDMRGGTIAMNFHDPKGGVFNFHNIEESAGKFNISLRTGCFCNPGAGEIAFGLTRSDMSECFEHEERASFEQCIIAAKGKTAGAVRVSLGVASNFSDAFRFIGFCKTFIDRSASPS